MPRAQVVRIPEELDLGMKEYLEGAAGGSGSWSGSAVEAFMIFSALFYIELVREGQIMAHSQEKHQQFIRLAASGRSLRSIGSAIQVSHGTLVGWKRKYAGRIAEMCSGDMDQLLDAWAEAKNQRIAKLAEQIARVEEELLERDLGKVSTGTLMRLVIRYREALRAEVEPMEINVQVDSSTSNYLAILEKCGVLIPDQVDPAGKVTKSDRS